MNSNKGSNSVPAVPKFLYRYLESREHAMRMLEGYVFVSTLHTVRTHPKSGDLKDSTLSYTVTNIDAQTSKEDEAVALSRLKQGGMIISPGNLVSNVSTVMTHEDAFVLCMSMVGKNEALRRIFGANCVRIAEPERFRHLLTLALQRHRRIQSFTFGPTNYRGRAYVDAAPPLGALGFASTKDNEIEREARILWNPADRTLPITGIELHVPDVASLCSLV